ncbi:retinoid-inducible serine carboxypeptidase-like [Bicyclus anynana]|uniref:Retinoid-inducible serine carboxypeptidase-like n=1 Tax=Bicyclus anynana TaxID=110368 RepID=A0ABM3LKH1_BICAN|nr:retinoid-inducible serine carboxypeptidase-like [Bicyclus anynana]
MKKIIIISLVILGLAAGAGLGVLIWWLVRSDSPYETILLEGNLGAVRSTAAFTRIHGHGDMFWWFYPSVASSPMSRPVLLWLHGVTGIASSYLANFGMFGPYDANFDRRHDSWVNDYNLLFVDAPLGTGFSSSNWQNTSNTDFPGLDENADHLLRTLQSFYDIHGEYKNAPLYVCSQGDGSQLALALTIKLNEDNSFKDRFKGIILGNPVISPALALTKLGFYLEELGYVDAAGREAIENFSNVTSLLVESEQFQEAFLKFTFLGKYINENTGAVAVNLAHIVEKLYRSSLDSDYFGVKSYLDSLYPTDTHINNFMDTVGRAILHVPDTVRYDGQRELATNAFMETYMKPIVDKVEHILSNSDVTVNIYNGNLDAVSNTPGQLEWVNRLSWPGQAQFLSSPRETLVFNRLIEGYFRESNRLRFYWLNVAGQLAPIDNPIGIRRILNRITNN